MKTLAALALLACSPAVARAEEAPLSMITTADLAAKAEQPKSKWDFALVDARQRVEFEEGHIPGAINLPAKQTGAQLPSIVSRKDRAVIFYCNGPNCTKSHKAARQAIAGGYSNILVYNEGLPAWGMAGKKIEGKPLPKVEIPPVSPAELAAMLKDAKTAPVILDVRDADEYPNFHLKGSVNIPLDLLEKKVKSLPKKPVVLVDHAGHQTAVSGRLLAHLGRTGVKRLDGGLIAWQQAGLPTEDAKK